MTRVRTVSRGGGGRPSEDRVFTTGNAVIVLDGSSQPEADDRNGGWLAETLGGELHARLAADPTGDLAALLASSIRSTVDRFGLVPGYSPSTTVSIVRWTGPAVDVLVLGDSPVVGLTRTGAVQQVRDDRLAGVAVEERRTLKAGPGFGFDHRARWVTLVDTLREHRNRPGGYWIGEAVPEAALQAHRATWRVDDLAAVLVMTDGVADGVDVYGSPATWPDAFALARHDLAALVEVVHEAEVGDPAGERWPRSKLHDDKTVALVEFDDA